MSGQRGFTLVSAIFLMVVLVILGAALVTISAVQHTTSAQALQAVRANYAARLGVEWAVAQSGCPAGTLTPGGGLSGFTVTVTCATSSHATGGATPQSYYIVDVTATGGSYGSVDFAQRKQQAKVLP